MAVEYNVEYDHDVCSPLFSLESLLELKTFIIEGQLPSAGPERAGASWACCNVA